MNLEDAGKVDAGTVAEGSEYPRLRAALVVLAVISLFIVLGKAYKGLWLTGIGALGVMLYDLINFVSGMEEARRELRTELAENPFRELGEAAVESVQLEWGWIVMFIGVGLIFAAAFIGHREKAA